MVYSHLNQNIPANDTNYSDSWRRVLNRLGEYTANIVQSLKMYPSKVELLDHTKRHILVRIHMPEEYVVLRIAPDEDLAREVYFGRKMVKQQLPAARILHYDLARSKLPFSYTLESYTGKISGDQIEQHDGVLYTLGRQVGRVLRRMHRVEADGWGFPTTTGRWKFADWYGVLDYQHTTLAPVSVSSIIFDDEQRTTIAMTIRHLAGMCTRPQLIHTAIGLETVRCTFGAEHVHLEAITDPGFIIGGDGLLDLAIGLSPHYAQEWVTGLFEGYNSIGQLNMQDLERLRMLQLLTSYWNTCQQYATMRPYRESYDQTLMLLAERE